MYQKKKRSKKIEVNRIKKRKNIRRRNTDRGQGQKTWGDPDQKAKVEALADVDILPQNQGKNNI